METHILNGTRRPYTWRGLVALLWRWSDDGDLLHYFYGLLTGEFIYTGNSGASNFDTEPSSGLDNLQRYTPGLQQADWHEQRTTWRELVTVWNELATARRREAPVFIYSNLLFFI